MRVVGLFSRLFAGLGYRLLSIQAAEDERRATASAIEDLDQRLSHLAAEVERLGRARDEDQTRFSSKLRRMRANLENSRSAESAARDALASQAQSFAKRIAAETAARKDAEAEREGERSRAFAAREAGAKAQGKLDLARQKIALLSAGLGRDGDGATDKKTLAKGARDPAAAMRAALRFRERGRLDLAVKVLERGGELSNAGYDDFYRHQLVDLDDNPKMQRAVRRSIERLPAAAPASQSAYLTTLCQHASLASLEPSSIELLLAKTRRAAIKSGPVRTACEGLRRRLEFGQAVHDRFEGQPTLIPLGLNCMTWTLPNRWGLRSAGEFASLFTPFAYGAHKFKAVVRALQTNFEDYCQVEKLKAVETEGGHLTPMRTDGLVFWNHNLGSYWVDDDFAKFRESVAEKVDRFRTACRAPDAVFMMSKAPMDYPAAPLAFLGDLNAALERFTGRTNNRLLLWNEFAETAGRHTVDPWTHVLNCPYPSADYVWYETTDSAEALAYEAGCAQAVVDSLQEWGLLRPRGGAARIEPQAAVAVG